jgi:hypothetical protein
MLTDEQVPKPWILRGGHQFTECVSLNVAIDPQSNIWYSAIKPNLHFGMIDPCVELHHAVDGIEAPLQDYSRYWHGYRIILWPLLDRFNLVTLRIATALLVLLGVAVFTVGLRDAIGPTPALIFTITLFSLTDLWRIWRIASHGISMSLILAGAGAFALLLRRSGSQTLWITSAAALGALFCFIDFMINPPMMPMILMFLVLAVKTQRPQMTRDPRTLASLSLALTVAAAWFVGYSGTWISKFGLAIWFSEYPAQMEASILHQITFRLYGLEVGSRMFLVPLLPTIEMILKAFESVGSITVILIAAAVYFHIKENRDRFDRNQFYLLLSPILIVFAWFELFSNHTQLHPNFVYRSASGAVALAISAALISSKMHPHASAAGNSKQNASRLG